MHSGGKQVIKSTLISVLFLAGFYPSFVYANPVLLTLAQGLNLMTAALATDSVLGAMQFFGNLPAGELAKNPLTWDGLVTDSGFTSHISGAVGPQTLVIDTTGVLTGSVGTDIVISTETSGSLGAKSISAMGEAQWGFNTANNTYDTLIYRDVGEDQIWKIIDLISRLEFILEAPDKLLSIYAAIGDYLFPNPPPAPPAKTGTITLTFEYTDAAGNNCYDISNDPLVASCHVTPDGRFTGQVTAPEPSSVSIVFFGLLIFGLYRCALAASPFAARKLKG